MNSVRRVSVVLLAALVAGGVVAPAPSSAASVDPERLSLRYGARDGRITRPLGFSWKRQPLGTWSVTQARRRGDGRLVVDVEIDLPDPTLPLEPGPAMVFGTLALSGGDSGVAIGVDFGRSVEADARPCPTRASCELRARIVLPANRIRRAANRNPLAIGAGSLDVRLVLVRTFAQGTWVQVLPLERRGMEGHPGTLGSPGSISARMRIYGMFTAEQGQRWLEALLPEVPYRPTLEVTERNRRSGGDHSSSPMTAPVRLDVDAGDCEGWSLMTQAGHVAFDETDRVLGRELRTVSLPVGSSWYVRSPSLWNIDEPPDTVQTFGPFAVGIEGLSISGSWTCGDPAGSAIVSVVEGTEAALGSGAPRCAIGRADVATEGIATDGELDGSWAAVAAAPIPGRFGHTATWTGDEVIIWGGTEIDGETNVEHMPTGGAAYDPETDTWRTVSEAPIAGRQGHSAVWTGSALIVWGGRSGDRVLRDGAVYYPEIDTWRPMSKLDPGYERFEHHAVWIGSQMIVWSGISREGDRRWPRFAETLAYNPRIDDWQELRTPQIGDRDADALVWTGELMFVVGYRDEASAVVAAYDPDLDQWYQLPDLELASEGRPVPVWIGPDVLFLSPESQPDAADRPTQAALRPSRSCWWTPAEPGEPHAATLEPVRADDLVIFPGRSGVAFEPSTDTWSSLPESEGADREEAPVVWTGDRVFVWGGRRDSSSPPLDDGVTFTPLYAGSSAESIPSTGERP